MTKDKILDQVEQEFEIASPRWIPSEFRIFIFYMTKHGRHLFNDTWIPSDSVSDLIKEGKLKCEGEHFHQGEKCIRYSFKGFYYPKKYYRCIAPELRLKILDRDNNSCVKCGALNRLSIDHIFPWSQGGWTEISNLQVLCRKCNSEKSNIY